MKKKALNYDAALAAIHEVFEDKRALPQQPDRTRSELRGHHGWAALRTFLGAVIKEVWT